MNSQTALVTGASRGIGKGIAALLAERHWGLTVTSRRQADLDRLAEQLRSLGAREVVTHAVDMADGQSLAALIDSHQTRFGTMDALIANAGVGTAGDIASFRSDRLDKTLEVNFTAAATLIRDSLPLLRKGAQARPDRGAKIIGLSSITGVYPERHLGVYGASKAALLSLLETVNLEEAPNGVTATGIAPGYVATDMSAWVSEHIPVNTMIPVRDIVAVVDMLLGLSPNTVINRVAMTRSAGTPFSA